MRQGGSALLKGGLVSLESDLWMFPHPLMTTWTVLAFIHDPVTIRTTAYVKK